MLPGLNQNELETLRILWHFGELKPGDIEDEFGWPIDNGTLRSVLANLVGKGHIARELRGKAYYYTARVPKRQLLRRWMESMARIFAGGSPRDLVAQLVETGDLAPRDLERLNQLARAANPASAEPARKRQGPRRKKGEV